MAISPGLQRILDQQAGQIGPMGQPVDYSNIQPEASGLYQIGGSRYTADGARVADRVYTPQDYAADYANNPQGTTFDQAQEFWGKTFDENKARTESGRWRSKLLPALALGIASGGVGFGLAGAGGLGGAGSAGLSGVSAGNATGSGLLSNFGVKQALTGALKGGLGGFASGGDIGSALKGAALGGLTGGYGNAIAGGLGLQGAGASAFTGGLQGAAGGLAQGDLKSAGIGAALGGAGGYLSGGGAEGLLGRAPETIQWNQGGSTNIPGTGLRGMLGGGTSGGSLGGLGNVKSYISPIASIYGGYQENKAIDEATKRALEGGDRAALGLQPFRDMGLTAQQTLAGNLQAGFNPGDLTNDPGYQFRLAESQKALDRSLASTGMTQSGAAIKAAQDRAQGLAATEYGDAYTRWLQQNSQLAGMGQQGLSTSGAIGDIYQNQGNVQGASALAKADSRNKTIAQILASLGL